MKELKRLKYAPMWKFGNTLYHFHDQERIPGIAELKFVVMDKNYFIRTSQQKDKFAVAIYDTEKEAIAYTTS